MMASLVQNLLFFLLGVGGSLYWCFGIVYLDDNMGKANSPFMLRWKYMLHVLLLDVVSIVDKVDMSICSILSLYSLSIRIVSIFQDSIP